MAFYLVSPNVLRQKAIQTKSKDFGSKVAEPLRATGTLQAKLHFLGSRPSSLNATRLETLHGCTRGTGQDNL